MKCGSEMGDRILNHLIMNGRICSDAHVDCPRADIDFFGIPKYLRRSDWHIICPISDYQ